MTEKLITYIPNKLEIPTREYFHRKYSGVINIEDFNTNYPTYIIDVVERIIIDERFNQRIIKHFK